MNLISDLTQTTTPCGAPAATHRPARRLPLQTLMLLVLALLLGGAAPSQAEDPAKKPVTLSSLYHEQVDPLIGDSDLLQFLLGGTPKVTMRWGYEYSDFDDAGGKDEASGLNVQSRFSYKTGTIFDSSAFIQLQHNWNLIEDYRWSFGGDTDHDVIADPDGARIHQLYGDFGFIPDFQIRVGLQEIVLDDSRFIGNVGWRQAAQSFNGVGVTYTGIEKTTLYAAYIWDVYDINLKMNPDIDDLILLRAEYKHSPKANLVLFTYLLDAEAASQDSATYGLRFYGTCKPVKYDATLAYQNDYADGDKDAFFASIDLSTVGYKVNVGGGYQYISGGGGEDNFATLFSTAHKFNGWADQFLSTNTGGLSGGLHDGYLTASTAFCGFTLNAAYHYFHSADDFGGFDGEYGQELDIDLVKPINDYVTAELKFAHYEANESAGNPTIDEDVLWVRMMLTF